MIAPIAATSRMVVVGRPGEGVAAWLVSIANAATEGVGMSVSRSKWTSLWQAPAVATSLLLLVCGCSDPAADPVQPSAAAETASSTAPHRSPPAVIDWRSVEDFSQPLGLLETVFWEPADTTSLRKLIRETDIVKDRTVLEIGTGSGLVALCCLQAGARRVVATDINPQAIACAAYNAQRLQLEDRLELRLVSQESPQAFAVLAADERFDLIISNPPWEDDTPKSIDQFALYDRKFALLRSLLDGLDQRLSPQGRALLAYGCVTAIHTLEQLAAERNLAVQRLDDRDLSQLPEVFLPGMLLEVRRGEPR